MAGSASEPVSGSASEPVSGSASEPVSGSASEPVSEPVGAGAGARPGIRGQVHRSGPLVLLGVGLYAVFGSYRLGPGELSAPGPGLWPLLVSLVVTVTAAVLVVVDDPGQYEVWGRGSVRIVAGLVSLGVFVVLFEALGFLVPAVAVLLLWLRGLGAETWRWAVPLAVGGAVILHLVFVEALGVPFPDDVVVDDLLGR